MGDWLGVYGESIYGTRGGYQMPKEGVALTKKEKKIYVHILKDSPAGVMLKEFPAQKIKRAYLLSNDTEIGFDLEDHQLHLKGDFTVDENNPDVVIVLEGVEG